MESKDLKIVLVVGILSLAMVASSYILGKSISTGLQYSAGTISRIGSQVGGAIAQANGPIQSLQGGPQDDIMNLSQAAVFLKISESELYNLLKYSNTVDGKGIPYYKINDKVYFSKTALSNWLVHSAENNFEY